MRDSETGADGAQKSTWRNKVGLAQMLRGGVIMDVTNAEQALIAAEAGAVAVMALERVPADIRREGGVARMADPGKIREIMESLKRAGYDVPVMAKARIGHFAEARILEALGVDFIDESEVLTPADKRFHIDKRAFRTPFVCGCRDLGEALRRIGEGAAMVRTKGEAGTGDVAEAVRHMRSVMDGIRRLALLPEEELMTEAKTLGAPCELVREVHETNRRAVVESRPLELPVPNFSAGGIATPADAALMRHLGAEAVFVGSGIFKSAEHLEGEEKRKAQLRLAKAIVDATVNYGRPELLAEISAGLGEPMRGIQVESIPEGDRLAVRGW